MFTSEYDIFFGAQDQQVKYFYPFSQSLSGTYSPVAEGAWASVASLTNARIGDIVTLSDGTKTLLAEIKFIDNTNSKLFLVPRQDRNNKLSSSSFTTSPATTISTLDTYQDIFSLPIDLSEAPDDWYQFLILAYMDLGVNTSASKANVRIARSEMGSLPLEYYCFARYTVSNTSSYFDDKYAYNAAFIVNLRGGSTNIFTIQGNGSGSTARCKFRNPRITAIKCTDAIFRGYPLLDSNNDTLWDYSTSGIVNQSLINNISINKSGNYIIIGSRTLSAPSGVTVTSEIKVDAVVIDDVVHTGRTDATDRHTQGFIGYQYIPSGSTISMWLKSGTSLNTVYAKCPFFAAIYVPNRTEEVNAPFSALLGAVSTGDSYVTSGSVFTVHPSLSLNMIESGFNDCKGLEIYSSDMRKEGNGCWEAAPVYSTSTLSANDPSPYAFNNNNATGARGIVGPRVRQRAFWFQRLKWNGYATGTLKARSFPTTDSYSAIFRNTYALGLPEKLPIPAREGVSSDIVGEFEYGAVVSNWTSASAYYSASTCYKKDLSGIFDEVNRVVLNSSDLLKKTDAYLTQRSFGSWSFNNDDPSVGLITTAVTSSYTVGGSDLMVSPTASIKVGQKILVINPNNTKLYFHALVLFRISGTLTIKVLNYVGDVSSGYSIDTTWIVTAVEGGYLYVNLPTGTDPYASSSGNRIVVIGKKRFSREITEFYDENLTPTLVDTRMTKLPTISQNLEIRGSQIKSTQSFNSIELSNGDGFYDNLPGRYIMDGMGIKIYRSWRNTTDSKINEEDLDSFRNRKILYRSLNYYETLVDGVQSAPEFGKEKYRINILPKVINSIKPLSEFTAMNFSGTDLSNIDRAARYPIIYGYARRVEAKRITPITYDETQDPGNPEQVHLYRIACHEIHSILGVWSKPNSTFNILNAPSLLPTPGTGIETLYEGSLDECKELQKRGIIAVKNKAIVDLMTDQGADQAPDSIYVDCYGRTNNGEIYPDGSAVIWPGEIIQSFLRAFPSSSDLSVAKSTTLASAALSSDQDGTSSIYLNENKLLKLTVVSRSGFLPGDRIKITDTTSSARFSDGSSPYFWAVVTRSYTSSGSHRIEAWPTLEPGDSIDGVRSYPVFASPSTSPGNVRVDRYISSSLYAVTTTTTASLNNKDPDPELEFTVSVSSTVGFFPNAEIEISYSGNVMTTSVTDVTSATALRVTVIPKAGNKVDGVYDYPSGSTVRVLPVGPIAIKESRLDTGSLRSMDHLWRKRLVHNYGALQLNPVLANFVIPDSKVTVANFLDKAAKTYFSYSFINRSGRLSFKPVGSDEFNLIPNAGFEQDPYSTISTSISYPLFNTDDGVGGEFNGGTFGTAAATTQLIIANRTSSLPAYEGQRCMKVTGGTYLSAPTPQSNAFVSVVLTKSGWYYLSCKSLGLSSNASNKHLRFAVSIPGDGYKQIETSPDLDISESITAATAWLQSDRAITDFADSAKSKANLWLQSDKVSHLYSNGGSVYSLLDYSINNYTINNYSKWPGAYSSNFTQWHKSDSLTTAGALSSWVDSGVGGTPAFSQSTTSLKPIVSLNFINGQPALFFTSRLLTLGTDTNLGLSHNIFIVFRTDYVDNDFTLLSNSIATTTISWIKSSGKIRYRLQAVDYEFSWTPVAKTWYVIAFNRSSNTISFYVNGVQVGSTLTVTNTTFVFNCNYLGALDANGGTSLKGYISEVILENTGSIECLVQGISALGSKFALNTKPAPTLVTSARKGCSSIRFDSTSGASTYLNHLAIDNNDTYEGIDAGLTNTVCFAIKPVVVNSFNFVIGSKDGGEGSAIYYRTNILAYRAGNSTPVSVSYTLSANTWYIITIQRDRSLVTFYVNGSQVGSVQDLGSQSTEPLKIKYIGAQYIDGTNYLNAELGELFCTQYLLSTEERQALEYYMSQKWGVSGPTAVSSERVFQLTDYSGNGNHFKIDGRWGSTSTLASSWWKPESLSSLANGASISTWADSANSRNFSQATSVSMPKYVSGPYGGLNGYGVLDFDGTNDTLALASRYQVGSLNTVVMVFRINTTDLGANYASGTVVSLLSDTGGSSGIDLFSGSIFYKIDSGGASGSISWTPQTNTWYVISFRRHALTQVEVIINGTPLGTITLSGSTTSNSFWMTTIGKNPSYSTYLKAQIAELITSNNSEPDLFAFDAHSYLCKKYNITSFVPLPLLTYNNKNSLSTVTYDDTVSSLGYYDYLSYASTASDLNASLDLSTNHTIVIVFNISTIENPIYLLSDNYASTYILIDTSGTVLKYTIGSESVSVSYSVSASNWYVLSCTRNGASVSFYINGLLVGSGNLTTTVATKFKVKTIGSKYPTGGATGFTSSTNSLTGNIAEVYMADRVLTSSQRGTLENAMLYKWGLAYTPKEEAGKWAKNELIFYLEPGEAGNAIIRIYPQYNSYTSESHYVDNFELYHIKGIVTDATGDMSNVDNEDENFYEIEVPYLINNSNQEQKYTMTVRDFDGFGLSGFLYSEAKGALPASGILKVDGVDYTDADSARGMGAAYARYFGRMRQSIKITILDAVRIPKVGDMICVKLTRAPVSADNDSIWTIIFVQVSGDMARQVDVTAIRQVDPWIDRNKRTNY